MWGRAEEEERSRLPAEWEAGSGAKSQDPEFMTRAEIRSWMLGGLSHPGAPENKILK